MSKEKKVFFKSEYDYETNNFINSYHGIGELAYCKCNDLKLFTKNKIYKIEKGGDKEYSFGKVKFVGIPGYVSFDDFDFVENNPALSRDVRINELMDIDFCEVKKNTERKINTLPFKNRILAQALLSTVLEEIEKQGAEFETSLSFDVFNNLIKNTLNKRGYQICEEDYTELANMSVKDFIDNFILAQN